jgi:hypothetical protein
MQSLPWFRRRLVPALFSLAGLAPLALRADILVIGPELAQSAALRSRLGAAQLTIRAAAADALNAIDPATTDAVVLASDRPLPSASRLGLSRYLAAGGQVAVVGPAQFDYAPRPVSAVPLPPAADGGYRLVSPVRNNPGRKVEIPESARLEKLSTPDGRPALGFRTYLRGMDDFLVEFDATAARSPRRTVLRFWAQGDDFMDLLAIEIHDTAGKRWFGFVPLEDGWQQLAISLADFLPEGWSDPAQPYPLLRPETIATVALGTNMATVWPERPMTLAIGGLELAEDAAGTYAPTSAIAPLRLPFRENDLAVPAWLFNPFARSTRATGKTLRIVAAGVGQSGPEPALPETWLCPVPNLEHPGPRMGTDHRKEYILKFQREFRCVPLWQAVAQDGSVAGNVAELRLASSGPEKGSAVALFGVTVPTLLATPGLLESFADTLVGFAGRPGIAGVTVDLQPASADGARQPALQVVVRNPRRHPVTARLSAEVATGALRGEIGVTIPAQGTAAVLLPLSAVPADFPFTRFDWRVTLASADGTDELRDTVDVERGLIYALRHLVRTQGRFPDGRISHHYFGDAYGVRAMFAYADLLRRQPGRLDANRDLWRSVSPAEIEASGTRFFDMLVRRQNEEGSFPMGYSEHLNVYNVADGGQISLGLAQAAPFVRDPVRRESYLQAARRFVDWAETFYIDEKLSAVLTAKYPKPAAKGETKVGLYGLGWGHLERNETGPFWVLGDLLGVQMLLPQVDANPDYLRIARRNLRNYLDAGYRADGYFWAEGLVWSWLAVNDPAERQRIAAVMEKSFIGTLVAGDAQDMYDRGARANLNALPLIYYRRYFGDSATLRAVQLKYVWAFASEDAPNAMRRVAETFPKPAHGESIAAAKQAASGALWAIELLEPGSSLLRTGDISGVPPAKP